MGEVLNHLALSLSILWETEVARDRSVKGAEEQGGRHGGIGSPLLPHCLLCPLLNKSPPGHGAGVGGEEGRVHRHSTNWSKEQGQPLENSRRTPPAPADPCFPNSTFP